MLPVQFADRMKSQLQEDWPAFLSVYQEPARRGARFFPEKAPDAAAALWAGLEAIPWAEDAFFLPADSELGKTIAHEVGLVYLQEPSAMIPAEVLAAKPGEILLDLCAAPGGKSTQIGRSMEGEGLLVCNEINPRRAQILSRNIERMGIESAVVTCEPPEKLARHWPEGFDGVLVDAPCSGEGMFRRDPESISEWSPDKALGCAERQRKILDSAAALVRPGGRLVYSTCTFHTEENGKMAAWFCRAHPEFTPASFSFCGKEYPEGMETFYPHQIPGEGQFVAAFRKAGAGKADLRFRPDEMKAGVQKLIREALPVRMPNLFQIGNRVFSLPLLPDLEGIRVLRAGLGICELRERCLIPDHALAMSCRAAGLSGVELSDEEALRYLRGEALRAEGSGWLLTRCRGMSLGWGKASQGVLKNHYPKGLRKNHLLP